MTDSTSGAKTNVIAALGACDAQRARFVPQSEMCHQASNEPRADYARSQAWFAPNGRRARNSCLPLRCNWPPGQTQPSTMN
jgi:hypothetical protein